MLAPRAASIRAGLPVLVQLLGEQAAVAAMDQVRFRRYRFCPTGELKYRGAVG